MIKYSNIKAVKARTMRKANMNNIILIGMSGAGKSTLGVLLAKAINKKFVDTDLILQNKHGKLLHEIISEVGIEVFKGYEEDMLQSFTCDHSVIATGGSVIYSRKGMERLRELGKVIYIQVDYPTICKRLGDITTRGVIMEEGQTLEALFNEREPLYKQYAHLVLKVDHEGVEQTVEKLVDLLS